MRSARLKVWPPSVSPNRQPRTEETIGSIQDETNVQQVAVNGITEKSFSQYQVTFQKKLSD